MSSLNQPFPEIVRSNGLKAWVVCFSAALFFFFEFMQLNMFNALSPALMEAFQVSGARLGQLSAHYFYANVLFLFTAGLVLDRVSTRKVILCAMSVCVACTYLFSLSTALWQAEACRFVTGIGGAFCFLSTVRLASRWFPPRRMALVIGLIVTMAMLGGMLAQTPFALLTDSIGWRKTLVLDASLGVLMLLIIAFFVKDSPKGRFDAQAEAHQGELNLLQSIIRSAKNKQNWLGGLYTSLMNLPIFLLGALWGSLYLVQIRHLSRPDSTWVTSMIFVGTILGSPFMGWLSDRLGRRRRPMLVSAVISLLIILVIMYTPELSLMQLLFLFFMLGFVTSAQIISYPLIAESNPLSLTGSAEGLASTLIMAGGFMQPVFGYFMELHWDHAMVNNVPLYSWSNYQCAMMIMPIAFIAAWIVALWVRETYGQTSITQGETL